MPALLVIASFPDIEIARHIGTSLIEKQLAACVNLHPSTESIYRWQGKVESATEVLALIKTSAERYPSLEAEIHSLHPYDVPEIIAIDIAAGLSDYVKWIADSCLPTSSAEDPKR